LFENQIHIKYYKLRVPPLGYPPRWPWLQWASWGQCRPGWRRLRGGAGRSLILWMSRLDLLRYWGERRRLGLDFILQEMSNGDLWNLLGGVGYLLGKVLFNHFVQVGDHWDI